MTQHKIFEITDPTPWLDQFVETINTMVRRCGGTSSEFVMTHMLKGLGNPNHLILGAHPEGQPSKLIGWTFVVFIPDTYKPWVEVWGLWVAPGHYKSVTSAMDHIVQWATAKGAVRIVGIATRSPKAQLAHFYGPVGFKQVGIVMERSL